MNIKINYEEMVSSKITRRYELAIGEEGKEITIEKWWVDDEAGMEYDTDYEITQGKEIFDALSEDDRQEVEDFINELK